MNMKLFIQAILKFISGVVLVSLLIFLPAGSFSYFGGLLLSFILFVPMFVAGIVLMVINPDLLRKRLDFKEKQKEQGIVIALSGIMFLTGFIVAGLGYRYNWYMLPKYIQIIGAIVFIVAYLIYAEVLRENIYLSRTIQVFENQKVIDTGLYGIVRHPMYSATILLFMSMPIVLGSLYSFIIFMVYPLIISLRIKSEEELLEKDLKGYKEYKNKVKYKLIPFIW